DAALDPFPERRPPLRALRSALASVAGGLSDEGGLVAPGALERLGLTRTRRMGPAIAPGRRVPRLVGRLGAAAAAGSLLGAGVHLAGAPPHVSAVTIGAAGALAVALLPRIGWLACAAALCCWLAIPNTGLAGAALVAGVAAVIVPPLLLRGGLLWSVPALAPLLGLAGIGPVFLVVAGLPATIWRRAGLAVAGFVWFALAEVADGRTLLFGPPNGTQPLHDWQGHFGGAASHALKPLITTPALLPAVAWA